MAAEQGTSILHVLQHAASTLHSCSQCASSSMPAPAAPVPAAAGGSYNITAAQCLLDTSCLLRLILLRLMLFLLLLVPT
jgi:hypothetical protein